MDKKNTTKMPCTQNSGELSEIIFMKFGIIGALLMFAAMSLGIYLAFSS
ncbi:MAG: hypothetical protein GY807_19830 [Gammaproteobacteria bacterium]|nr:hypothetical protein [Gammaproteobacteria bacterium]